MVSGGNGSARLVWLSAKGASMVCEKPGTMVATRAPMVANRLACIQ